MPRRSAGVHARPMKPSKWVILGALAGYAAIAISKQLRLTRHRLAEQPDAGTQPEAGGRASIDDVPTVQPQSAAEMPRGPDESTRFDENVAPGAPL
jgi:hypothetical protein